MHESRAQNFRTAARHNLRSCAAAQLRGNVALYYYSWLKCVIMAWSAENGQNTNWCSCQYWFSRFWRVLWSAVQHIPWVDRYSGGASQDCMPLPWAQKVCIYGVIQCHGQNIELPSLWNHFSICWGVFWSLVEHLPQAERCSGVVSQHCVILQLDQKVCIHGLLRYKWLEHWPASMAKPVFMVLRNLLVLDRASSACKKVFRCSQSALCTTTVGSESMYS